MAALALNNKNDNNDATTETSLDMYHHDFGDGYTEPHFYISIPILTLLNFIF